MTSENSINPSRQELRGVHGLRALVIVGGMALAGCAGSETPPSAASAGPNPHDGQYTANITGQGICANESVTDAQLSIANGRISGDGRGWRFSGTVAPDGKVNATADGRARVLLRGQIAGGKASGDFSTTGCNGVWEMAKK